MATKKQGVGIWSHYRTSETPKADGLRFVGEVCGYHTEARLYWAPADFSHPDEGNKQPYVVMWFQLDDELDWNGCHVNELHNSEYVGDERPRRNWKELCAIGETLGIEHLEELVWYALHRHEAYLAAGFKFENKTYVFPTDKTGDEAIRMANEHYQKALASGDPRKAA
jgi:hypothetical protein